MDLTILPVKKILNTYQRFKLPVTETEPPAIEKLQFFYIGVQSRYTEKLNNFFEFGYTTLSVDSALFTLKRLLNKQDTVILPDAIIAEATLGTEGLVALHRFVASSPLLADVPFIVEGTGLSTEELALFKGYAFIDELIFMSEFTVPALLQKVNFLKKVKQKWVHEPKACRVEKSFPVFPSVGAFLKRGFDLVLSALMIVLVTPFMALIALAIKLESGGPVFQPLKRTGRGFRIFDLYNFSTTVPGAEEHATKVGWFLRKTGLDEMPQLLNVLLGDLSLVGNRALPLDEAARLTTGEWAEHFLFPSGMTGSLQMDKSEKETAQIKESKPANNCGNEPASLYDFWVMANRPSIIQKTKA